MNKIGFTCSAFDLLHAGHISMLEEAKSQCDFLVVGLHTDPTIDRPKKNKPIQTILERYIQLEGCRYVDKIIPYDTEDDLINLLMILNPDVRIIGEEYKTKDFTGKDMDIPIYYNRRQHDYSSSALRLRLNA
jgi:glycerol-3-phosphate cytidylyltransferase